MSREKAERLEHTGRPWHLVENGYIAQLRLERKGFKCHVCGYPIQPGNSYYTVVKGGGGLGWLKHPDRVHLECLERYLEVVRP